MPYYNRSAALACIASLRVGGIWDALEAVADTALARNIGARGLRAVMEGLLTRVMYDVPSDPTISDVTITKACVDGDAEPTVLHDPEKVAQRAKFKTGTAEKTSTAPAS